MKVRRCRWINALLIVFLLLPFIGGQSGFAQTGQAGRAIDLMIVLDNSCSMFPKEMIIRGCTVFGSDPEFLRIKGADLFLARLGFGQENEAEYQVGVVSLGDEPELISPLKPLQDNRDRLAQQIADPAPQIATRIVPALQMAYAELQNPKTRKPGNLPAIVLITDGVPYPSEGQSETDIQTLVQGYPNIPIFFMLLRGVDSNLEAFDRYMKFWQKLQQLTDHVYVYLIENPSQIEDTYNQIVALLQDTIPSQASQITPGGELLFYVGQYTSRVILTITYPVGVPRGKVQVIDPRGQVVQDGEPGVAHFLGDENPVEVISISAPRLAQEYKDQYWKIKSDWVANVFVDREGAYRIEFLAPQTETTDISNVFRVTTAQSPRQKLTMKFRLVTEDGETIKEAQTIRMDVRLPDGTQAQAPITSELKPDAEGVYELSFDFPVLYPYIGSEFGRFVFILHAGVGVEQAGEQLPITSARLLIDVGPIPFIQLINPARLECTPNTATRITVTIGDYLAVVPDTLTAVITSQTGEVRLEGDTGELRGDLTGLCASLLTDLQCGGARQDEFELKIEAQLEAGYPFEPIRRTLPVEVLAPTCTSQPTPTEAVFVLPTAIPTPIPDSDADGFNDLLDACPAQMGGWLFSGCPTPLWAWLAGACGVLGIIALWVTFVWPWIKVRTIAKPPDVYIMVCRRNSPEAQLISVRAAGMRRRHAQVKIGGDRRKADIFISGLKPVEFVVLEKDEKILLTEAVRGEVRAAFRLLAPELASTSNPEIHLWLAIKRNTLENMRCS